jgi:nucleotidyltransferase/DNA polymerase involved in DNA repair
MRVAFVYIPRFPCAVEVQRRPDLAGQPLIVGDAEQPKRILDCSQEAYEAGVRYGMNLRKALGLCPQAAVLPPDPVLYRSRWRGVLDALDEIAPQVEDEELGRAYLNVAGLERHYRDDGHLAARICETVRAASGLLPRIGIAGGKLPARAAASSVEPGGVCAVPPGSEAAFLAPMDVDLLPVEVDVVERLRMLGLETLGEVAALSLPELQSQFGFEGARIWELANGADRDPIRPREHREEIVAGLSFEAPVAGVDVLIAGARQLLSRLRLPLKGRAARELTLQAELSSGRGWEQRLVFREAVSENDRLLFLLRSSLANFPPPEAVNSLSLQLGGLAGESGKQLHLGDRPRLQRQLEEAIQQLKARYGYSPVYRCLDMEPWSVIPEERQILVESDA